MKKILFFAGAALMLQSGFNTVVSQNIEMSKQTITTSEANYGPARIYKAMAKGRRGEDLTIGVIGGSITQGSAASSESKRWANQMTEWWKAKFPESKVTLINAGWGGTGSDIGVHRIYDDLLKKKPDFIVIEFSVNDYEGELAKKMMEGLVQQIILDSINNPGMMILMLKQDNGTTAQASHKPVGYYYNVPMVSFADMIDSAVQADGIALSSIFADGLHPNDKGMTYIADFLKVKLDSLYATLPSTDAELPAIDNQLPTPLVTDTYSHTFQFFQNNIVPLSNNGWMTDLYGWNSETIGKEITFQVTGNAVSLIYTQNIASNRGQAEVWVDNGPKKVINCYMNEDWGTRYSMALVAEGLADGEHTLHVKVIETTSTSGHYVQVTRIMTAGNIGSAPPIAKTPSGQKAIVNTEITLIGTESFDPDGTTLESYAWSFASKPNGSAASISNADKSTAKFTPDIAGDYKVQLIVGSTSQFSVPAYQVVKVRQTNNKPVAVTGNDTLAATGKVFKLDGTKSYDADSDALTFLWKLESKPASSLRDITGAENSIAQIRLDVDGEYVFSLVVNDSLENSEPKIYKVTAKTGYTGLLDSKYTKKELQVYPNPAGPIINLDVYLTEISPVKIELYSILGVKVTEELVENVNLGLNTISVSTLDKVSQSGIYVVKVTSGNYTGTKRINIIK